MDGQIGTGGPRIKLGNVNGGIQVTHVQDGLPLSPAVSIPGSVRVVREINPVVEVDISGAAERAELAEQARARIQSQRIAREAQREAQRQVTVAIRDSQRGDRTGPKTARARTDALADE